MTPNEYQEEAMRTDSKSYIPVVHRIASDKMQLIRLIHAHLGMSSETGETADAIKKHLIYGQPLDVENIFEECGDKLWYIVLALSAIDRTLDECMQHNIDKLKLRYPEKFTEELAKERLDKKSE